MFFWFRVDLSAILVAYLGLFLFGLWFDRFTGWAEKNGYSEGYTSLFVVAGVLIVLVSLTYFSWMFSLLALGAFVAAGVPMIIGSIARYLVARRASIESAKRGE
jgi:hypothetical protein